MRGLDSGDRSQESGIRIQEIQYLNNILGRNNYR